MSEMREHLHAYTRDMMSYTKLINRFSNSLSTECVDGTHQCVEQATCLQSLKSSGYLCQCGSGRLGNGFKTDIGKI